MRLHKEETGALPESGNDSLLEWPVCTEGYWVWNGQEVYPRGDQTRVTFPLMNSELFLSFARLGSNGEPSKDSILKWIHQHGLLRRKGQRQPEEPARWLESTQGEVVEEQSISLEDFRVEVRTVHQLLSLYSDVRERNADRVMDRWFFNPPSLWPNTQRSLVDRYLERHLERDRIDYGGKERRYLEEIAINVHGVYLKRAIDLIRRCLNEKLAPSQPLLEWNWWDRPEPSSTSVGFMHWYDVPDLLTGMYLQLYVVVANKKPTRRCGNPACRMSFPVTRRNKRFCNDSCRSNARHYR
jgi:hypothetical protein